MYKAWSDELKVNFLTGVWQWLNVGYQSDAYFWRHHSAVCLGCSVVNTGLVNETPMGCFSLTFWLHDVVVNQLSSGFERKTALLYTPSPVTRFHARSTFPHLWTHLLARIADKLLIVSGHTLVGKVQITFMFKNKKLAVTVLYADRLVRSTCRWRQVRTSELLRPREFKTSNDRLCICHYYIGINGAISCLIKIQYWIRYCFRLRYQGVLENRLLNYFFNNSCIASYQWWSAIAAVRYIVALSYDLMALYKCVYYYYYYFFIPQVV